MGGRIKRSKFQSQSDSSSKPSDLDLFTTLTSGYVTRASMDVAHLNAQ